VDNLNLKCTLCCAALCKHTHTFQSQLKRDEVRLNIQLARTDGSADVLYTIVVVLTAVYYRVTHMTAVHRRRSTS
jgi:hypothetical protein